jgi:hypothetical protein
MSSKDWAAGLYFKPQFITEPGETFPLFAQDHGPSTLSYRDFANDNLEEPDDDEPHKWKLDRKSCITEINNKIQKANTATELNKRLNKFTQQEDKAAYTQWHNKSGQVVNDEVELALLTNEIRLKFTPQPLSRVDNKHPDTIRGSYQALVTLENGEEKFFDVANNWVEMNFTAESLGIIQRIAMDLKEVVYDKDSSTKEFGYLNLVNEGQDFIFDNRQVSKIRWVPAKDVRQLDGSFKRKEGFWKGAIQTNRQVHASTVILPDDWVQQNISLSFQQLLKDLRRQNKTGFVLIPEGANELPEGAEIQFLPNAPVAKYWDPANSTVHRRCVLNSAASGMHYLGLKTIAYYLNSAKQNSRNDERGMEMFVKIFNEHSTKPDRRLYQLMQKPKRGLWNMLQDCPKYALCLLGVRSIDGKTDHCICIVKNWIFDSNFEKALPLTTDSLNLCASGVFVDVTRGYLLKYR